MFYNISRYRVYQVQGYAMYQQFVNLPTLKTYYIDKYILSYYSCKIPKYLRKTGYPTQRFQ